MGFGRDDALLGSVASCERKVNEKVLQVGFSHFKFYYLSCFYWLCVRVKCCVCIHPIISLASLQTESTNATQVHIPNSSCVEWQRPNDGFYKCNIDVACVCSWKWANQVWILCAGSAWPICYGSIHLYPAAATSPKGEACSLLLALQWMRDLGLDYVFFEMDCKPVVDCIHKSLSHMTEFGDLIHAPRVVPK